MTTHQDIEKIISIMGARKMLSRVEMNAPPRGALDSLFRAGAPVCLDNGRCRHTRNDACGNDVYAAKKN